MSANGISTLSTKELRQKAKLDLAALKRQGYTLYADGTTNFGSLAYAGATELSLTTKTAFGFGTGDFTIEGWFNPTTIVGNVLFDFRTAASDFAIYLNLNSSGEVRLYINGAYVIATTATLPTSTWSHVAVSRYNGLTKVFVNGTQSGVTYTDTNNYGTTKPLFIGASYTSGSHFVGYVSNIRIINGTAAYTGNFTPSKSPFTASVPGTQLVLNTDYGVNFLQDISINNFTLTNTGVTSSNTSPGPDTDAIFYRTRATYDISQLPTQYDDNGVIDNANTGGLVLGRPWINTTTPFTFFETFGTTTAISTTQYVSGNKIYALSSTFDVPGVPNARVVVNDIEVLNVGNGVDRGHHIVVLDSYGNLISATRYDTWDTGGAPGASTALASALSTVASGNIAVLVVYDASALTAGVRAAINTGYGSTNSNTWTSFRNSHIFIGVKI
jgi:hypothetical protein